MQSQHDDCLFCQIARDGAHVASTKGFVAVKDINPKSPVHLLVIPERHLDSFRDIGELSAHDSKRMLGFIAETAKNAGLEDYRIEVNVGASAGQSIFHLHWHILGHRVHSHDGDSLGDLTAVTEL